MRLQQVDQLTNSITWQTARWTASHCLIFWGSNWQRHPTSRHSLDVTQRCDEKAKPHHFFHMSTQQSKRKPPEITARGRLSQWFTAWITSTKPLTSSRPQRPMARAFTIPALPRTHKVGQSRDAYLYFFLTSSSAQWWRSHSGSHDNIHPPDVQQV